MQNFDRVRIVIVDDHPVFRDGLRGLLEIELDFEVIGAAENGKEVMELLRQRKPNIVLLDVRLPGRSGFSVLEQIRLEALGTKAIVLTAADDEETIVESMKQGASGIVFKRMATQRLVEASRIVHADGIWLDSASSTPRHRCSNSPSERTAPARFSDTTYHPTTLSPLARRTATPHNCALPFRVVR